MYATITIYNERVIANSGNRDMICILYLGSIKTIPKTMKGCRDGSVEKHIKGEE